MNAFLKKHFKTESIQKVVVYVVHKRHHASIGRVQGCCIDIIYALDKKIERWRGPMILNYAWSQVWSN